MRARILALLLIVPVASAAGPAQEVPKGVVLEKVTCASDPGQSYALYLPSGYSRDRKWAVLYAFDPRARGLVPVQRFRDAAERLGVIVAGSNNSRNGPVDQSLDAMNAMARDTQARLALDNRRVYVTGFSGGARVAATVGLAAGGRVAGVIGFGAGFLSQAAPSPPVPFAFFGAAGTDDFNYPELRRLDQALGRIGARHRLEVFTGGHDWPPETVCARALEWVELQSMLSGTLARDAALVDGVFARAMAETDSDERAGRRFEAWQRAAAMASDFAGLGDVTAFERKARQLERTKEVGEAVKALEDSVGLQAALEAAVVQYARTAREARAATTAGADLLAALTDAKKQADAGRESARRMAARRTLTFFWSRFAEAAADDVARGEFARAAVCYRAMARIRPENAEVEYSLAGACARSGDRKEAIAALRRAVGKGFADASRLKQDPDLESLRGDPAFRRIVEALEKGRGRLTAAWTRGSPGPAVVSSPEPNQYPARELDLD